MDNELKEGWISDLRSGDFPQGKNVLVNLDENNEPIGYCCLGVLMTRIATTRPDVQKSIKGDYNTIMSFEYKGLQDSCVVPDTLMQEIGLTYGAQEHLIGMNDSYGNNFNEIADWIEEYV
jgi:hypothetical protein